ncbi:hypothetical protein HanIR_Chr14g0695211 [Helianthus annuus]|nr:hypothetical protein HanIR_Chr14g0695211 [Helianthus annuus]
MGRVRLNYKQFFFFSFFFFAFIMLFMSNYYIIYDYRNITHLYVNIIFVIRLCTLIIYKI